MAEMDKKGDSQIEEIKELERLLEAKKQALKEAGVEKEPKEAFKEVFKEYVERQQPSVVIPSAPSITPVLLPDEQKKKADDAAAQKREEQLDELIGLSFQKSIMEAVIMAQQMTPWLLDELHDRLVDEYYEKLVASQQVKDL